MPEVYPIPEASVVNRTIAQALHEAHCISPGCRHTPTEADLHLGEVALAWVRLRTLSGDVFERAKEVLEKEVDPEACPDPECSWENHNAAAVIVAVNSVI